MPFTGLVQSSSDPHMKTWWRYVTKSYSGEDTVSAEWVISQSATEGQWEGWQLCSGFKQIVSEGLSQGSQETETMGKAVLAYQFVSGLYLRYKLKRLELRKHLISCGLRHVLRGLNWEICHPETVTVSQSSQSLTITNIIAIVSPVIVRHWVTSVMCRTFS